MKTSLKIYRRGRALNKSGSGHVWFVNGEGKYRPDLHIVSYRQGKWSIARDIMTYEFSKLRDAAAYIEKEDRK